jgi:hypothetical protein
VANAFSSSANASDNRTETPGTPQAALPAGLPAQATVSSRVWGFTLADINLMPVLYFVQRFPEGAEMVRSAGALADYFARHAERPSYNATIPPPHTPEVVARIRAAAAAREPVA